MPGQPRVPGQRPWPAPTGADLAAHPGARIARARAELGEQALVDWCADLLGGRLRYDDSAAPSITWLGGRSAAAELSRGQLAARGQEYWVRVWAARALLYAWTDRAAPAVVGALGDPSWRVREMAAKVIRLRELGEAGDTLAGLAVDEVVRVRVAAIRAVGAVGEAEHADALHEAQDDADPTVRRAASTALSQLARRLDREL